MKVLKLQRCWRILSPIPCARILRQLEHLCSCKCIFTLVFLPGKPESERTLKFQCLMKSTYQVMGKVKVLKSWLCWRFLSLETWSRTLRQLEHSISFKINLTLVFLPCDPESERTLKFHCLMKLTWLMLGKNESLEITEVLKDSVSNTMCQNPEPIRTFKFLQMYLYPSLSAL